MRFFVVFMVLSLATALDNAQFRQMAAESNTTCFLVFGDSTVDPGNNNGVLLTMKSNFPPYGKDFINGQPTGRFCNGRLTTDFIAEAFGYTNVIKAYLDQATTRYDMLHGVSFASAGSGYDRLTTTYTVNFSSGALPFPEQLEYFKNYKTNLRQLAGEAEAENIIGNAVVIISMGTNDFVQNYYYQPLRSHQFTLDEYQNYLISSMSNTVKELHLLGIRKLAVAGVPPFGCLPIVRTFSDESKCNDEYNEAAISFNSKIKRNLASLSTTLGLKTCYIDIYTVVARTIQQPYLYGFEEASRGCCGSGAIEYGITCRGRSTCPDRTKYVFWDAIHPTETMYQIIASEATKVIAKNLLK